MCSLKNLFNASMDKLKLKGLNLGRVFNYSCGRVFMKLSKYSSSKQPDLELKTRPKPVLGSLPLAFALPDACHWNFNIFYILHNSMLTTYTLPEYLITTLISLLTQLIYLYLLLNLNHHTKQNILIHIRLSSIYIILVS